MVLCCEEISRANHIRQEAVPIAHRDAKESSPLDSLINKLERISNKYSSHACFNYWLSELQNENLKDF